MFLCNARNYLKLCTWNDIRTFSCTKWNLYQQHQKCQPDQQDQSPVISNQSIAGKYDWNRIVSDAEKIVGYPTSFLNLRWLLSDEISNLALHLRKLIGTNHPLVKTVKHLLFDDKSNMQAWGLIILLISKTVGNSCTDNNSNGSTTDVLLSQRVLAEIIEMIRISFVIHKSLVNLQNDNGNTTSTDDQHDMNYGNKISILSGDYLLGYASAQLASLRNQDVTELISSTIRDMSEADFIGERDQQNNPLPTRPIRRNSFYQLKSFLNNSFLIDSITTTTTTTTSKQLTDDQITDELIDNDDYIVNNMNHLRPLQYDNVRLLGGPAEKEWEIRSILGGASLLGKGCQSAIKLTNHTSISMINNAYLFGKHLALAWQAYNELEPFLQNHLDQQTFSLVSAPVLYHLEYDPLVYDDLIGKRCKSVSDIDYKKLFKCILNGPALWKTKNLHKKHIASALRVLNRFPSSDARTSLQNLIVAMEHNC